MIKMNIQEEAKDPVRRWRSLERAWRGVKRMSLMVGGEEGQSVEMWGEAHRRMRLDGDRWRSRGVDAWRRNDYNANTQIETNTETE